MGSGKNSNPIWSLFSSVKLTIILLILLAVSSILGTLIPQQESSLEFIRESHPGLVSLLNTFQLFDMYHSIWFRFIIFFLAANLIICSLDRLPRTLTLFRLEPRADRSRPFDGLPPQRILRVKGTLGEVADKITESLMSRYEKIIKKDTGKISFIYGERGRYSLFGVYIVHFSVLIILIGAIVGSLFGFNAYVNIVEGESVDSVVLRSRGGHYHKRLGFNVHCEKFTVDFYENGAPKEFRSDLSFIVDGKTIHEASLLVNHPISFEGMTFYQASYGTLPGEKVYLTISKDGANPRDWKTEVQLGKPVPLPSGEGQFVVSDVRNNFMRLGTAVLISIKMAGGKETQFWLFRDAEKIEKRMPGIFERFPKFNPSAQRPYTFHLDDVESKYYTGLEVNRDPGVFLVYIGFTIIMIGLLVAFFTSHRRIWIRVESRNGMNIVSVAGNSNKNPVGMERELDRLVHRLHSLFNNSQ